MLNFIRPELRREAWRAREILAGLGVCLAGLWWVFGASGMLSWLGWPVLVVGGGLIAMGIQRFRFRRSGTGPGYVEITEAQISYFGPLDGGSVATDMLAAVLLDQRGRPDHWVLIQSDQTRLHIPVTAMQGEALFDAFAALPGFPTETMLAALARQENKVHVLWRKPGFSFAQGVVLDS